MVLIDPGRGLSVTVAATGDIERVVLLPGLVGDLMVVAFRQALDGRKTWPLAIAGAQSQGGVFVKTCSSAAVDVYGYQWIGGVWLEVSRALLVA